VIDIHYTPDELSKLIVSCVGKSSVVTSVADFAAGEGSLLRAASNRWPLARMFANDLSKAAVQGMRKRHPTWTVTQRDFLSRRLGTFAESKYDVILLNPPFSRRGRPPVSWSHWGKSCSSGVGLAFVSRALEFLAVGGTLVAVLPDGAFVNLADRLGWAYIHSQFQVERVLRNCSSTFENATAHTSVVRITRTKGRRASVGHTIMPIVHTAKELPSSLNLVRGRQQMHVAQFVSESRKGLPFVHTTDLRLGVIDARRLRSVASGQVIKGPALLLPRVGYPNASKICILMAKQRVVLSDCVIAVTCNSSKLCKELRKEFIGRWDLLEDAYRGTGARFITLQRLRDFLLNLSLREPRA
jgi:tRNA1(Val) A37 N6-methylase TrmN6